jgi:hypothetical protein
MLAENMTRLDLQEGQSTEVTKVMYSMLWLPKSILKIALHTFPPQNYENYPVYKIRFT